jgi:hypothetical protein
MLLSEQVLGKFAEITNEAILVGMVEGGREAVELLSIQE